MDNRLLAVIKKKAPNIKNSKTVFGISSIKDVDFFLMILYPFLLNFFLQITLNSCFLEFIK